MSRWTIKTLWLSAVAAMSLMAIAGCGKKSNAIDLHFVFQDARGITVGDRVMGDGVEVGRVIAPPESPKPKHVVVSVRIDRLSPEKRAYLTQELTAAVRKDSLGAGQTYLDLIFPSSPGVTVEPGTVLKGRDGPGGPGDAVDLASITIPKDPQQFLAMLQTAFVAVDQATAGATVFYLNWISIIVAVLTLVVLVLDLLLRLPQGTERERSSPLILRQVWSVFCLILVARFFVGVIRALGGLGILGPELLDALRINSSDVMGLLGQEWPFWILVIVLATIRFKFQLLTRVK